MIQSLRNRCAFPLKPKDFIMNNVFASKRTAIIALLATLWLALGFSAVFAGTAHAEEPVTPVAISAAAPTADSTLAKEPRTGEVSAVPISASVPEPVASDAAHPSPTRAYVMSAGAVVIVAAFVIAGLVRKDK
jgi:hypothetical protein